MNAREVAFRDQFRLRRQPMLHMLPLQRTVVHITEVGSSRHFVGGRRKVDFVLI